MRTVPVDLSPSWYRTIANAVNALINAVATLQGKTGFATLGDYADDAAAAAGGIEVGQLYRNGSVVMVRVA